MEVIHAAGRWPVPPPRGVPAPSAGIQPRRLPLTLPLRQLLDEQGQHVGVQRAAQGGRDGFGGGDADGDTARPEARLDGGGVGRQFVRGHGLGGRDGPFAGDAGQRIHLCPRGAPPCRVYYPRHRCGCSLDSASPHRVRWWHRRCPCFSTGHCPLETSRSSGRRREWIRLCPWGFPYCVYYHQLGLTWENV